MASQSQNISETNCSVTSNTVRCPVCNRDFANTSIEDHVNKCLFLNTEAGHSSSSKRSGSHLPNPFKHEKRFKSNINSTLVKFKEPEASLPTVKASDQMESTCSGMESKRPWAEQMRPLCLDDIVGQTQSFGAGSMLRSMLEQKKIPNMILWGPPGCGKTSLANVVANICKVQANMRFVKLSAAIAGINDVKEVVKIAKNEAQFKRQTVLFMDEIHRFNKLQQDTFLPHVENGTITLIGATTENPSFSLNNSLLSRCRVVVMEKLTIDDVLLILERTLKKNKLAAIVESGELESSLHEDEMPKCLIERASLRWLAEVCDGDARVALGALELALSARDPGARLLADGPAIITLEDIKSGIQRSHMEYDRQGSSHYDAASALHKAVRAGRAGAALYWAARMLAGGEDPLYVARRLVRAAAEDVGLADPNALVEAVACYQGCQQLGRPECDVLLAQCAVRLARAPKSRAVLAALRRCQRRLAAAPLPPVPLHLRNAPTQLMRQLGYGRGYNTLNKEDSGLTYMPEGMEEDFFNTSDDEDDAG